MIGKPKFKVGDIVKFKLGDVGVVGRVYIVDKYGTFMDNSDVSYDIMVEDDSYAHLGIPVPCLYKHIREDLIYEEKVN